MLDNSERLWLRVPLVHVIRHRQLHKKVHYLQATLHNGEIIASFHNYQNIYKAIYRVKNIHF